MRDELNKILSNVNDWLKFAEAKNAVLIAFNCAGIGGIMQAYPSDKTELMVFKGIIILLFALSICISIYTFLPVLNRTFKYQKFDDAKFEAEKKHLNCYFFDHFSKINCKQLLDLLRHKLSNSNQSFTDFETDIADQIINNAEITVSKFKLFTWAAYITFMGVVIGVLVILLYLFF